MEGFKNLHVSCLNGDLQKLYERYYGSVFSFFNCEKTDNITSSNLSIAQAKWICCSDDHANDAFWIEMKSLAASGSLVGARALSSYMLMKNKLGSYSVLQELFRANIKSIDSEFINISCKQLSHLIFLGGDLWRLNESKWLNISLAKCVAIALNDLFDVTSDNFYESCSLEAGGGNSVEYCSIFQKFVLLESIAAEAERCDDKNLWSWLFSQIENCCFNDNFYCDNTHNEFIRPLSLRCWLRSGDRRYLSLVSRPFEVIAEESEMMLQIEAVSSSLLILRNAIYENRSNY